MSIKTKAELQAQDIYSIIEFKSDGKFYADGVQEGTWTQSGSTVTVSDGGENIKATLNGNVLTFSQTQIEEGDTYNRFSVYQNVRSENCNESIPS